ncbi:MAG: SEC-C metal-binding domain-containing protein [Planctomycetota bacterium]
MIAPNNSPVGRNGPCPCGSGLKYKRCCLDPQVKALRLEVIRYRTIAHLALTQLQGMTGTTALHVPKEVLGQYPRDCAVRIVKDAASGDFLFTALPACGPAVIGPRRIVLPR